MFKNFKDWKTTIMGIFILIIPIIIFAGWLSPEGGNFLTEQIAIILGGVQAVICGITSIFLFFKKD